MKQSKMALWHAMLAPCILLPLASVSAAASGNTTAAAPQTASESEAAFGTSMLGGRYVASTDVQGILDLSLDGRQIKDEASDANAQMEIYNNGRNGYIIRNQQTEERESMSYADLSTASGEMMRDDLIYNLYLYAFNDLGQRYGEQEMGQFAGQPVEEYADAIVRDLFIIDVPNIVIEGIQILNVWMATVHELWSMYTACTQDHDPQTATEALDRSAALWIGLPQDGYSLYNLAHEAGARFNQIDSDASVSTNDDNSGEAKMNTRIIQQFNQLQQQLSAGQVCSSSNGDHDILATTETTVTAAITVSISSFRDSILETIGFMSVPLLQNMIHHIANKESENMPDFINIYGLSIIPRIMACDPQTFQDYLNMGALNTLSGDEEKKNTIQALQNTYATCFHVRCADVGSYNEHPHASDLAGQCNDEPTTSITLGGYTSPEQSFVSSSTIDRDVRHLGILIGRDAMDAALDVYLYGTTATAPHSLHELATRKLATRQSHLGPYKAMFDSSMLLNADYTITNALQRNAPFNKISHLYASELITGLAVSVLLQMSITASISTSIEKCLNNEVESSVRAWDEAVAFYVGSMESTNGSSFGQNLYATSKELCKAFGTCAVDVEHRQSNSNLQLIELFQSNRERLHQEDCATVQASTLRDILPLLHIPLFQGYIAFADLSENPLNDSKDHVEGAAHAFAMSIQPIIKQVDSSAIATLQKSWMMDAGQQSTYRPTSAIVSSLQTSVTKLAIDCKGIGNWELDPENTVCNEGCVWDPNTSAAGEDGTGIDEADANVNTSPPTTMTTASSSNQEPSMGPSMGPSNATSAAVSTGSATLQSQNDTLSPPSSASASEASAPNSATDQPSFIPSDTPSLVPTQVPTRLHRSSTLFHHSTSKASLKPAVTKSSSPTNSPTRFQTRSPTPSPTRLPTATPTQTVSIDTSTLEPTTAFTTPFSPVLENNANANTTDAIADLSNPANNPVSLTQVSETTDGQPALYYSRFQFSNAQIANGFASFALDVRDMTNAASTDEARSIYREGKHATASGFADEVTFRSLSSLSVGAQFYMSDDPVFNIFKFGLYSEDDFSTDRSYAFADEIVSEALRSGNDTKFAAEASVALNVWMMLTHKLHAAVRACIDGNEPLHHIDAAVALWIGKGVDSGALANGWLLYSMIETASTMFGHTGDEAPLNSEVALQFNDLKSLAQTCDVDALAPSSMRAKTNQIIKSLTIPLMQHLMHAVALDDTWRVELYSVAIFPYIAACNKAAFDELSQTFFVNFSATRLSKKVMSALRSCLDCLEITCQDIAVTNSSSANAGLRMFVDQLCSDEPHMVIKSLPSTSIDNQTAYARMELDVKRIDVFFRAKSPRAALDCYEHGHGGLLSNGFFVTLKDLATLPGRANVTHFDAFSQYFGSDMYAHEMMLDLMEQDGRNSNLPGQTTSDVSTRTFQSLITPMAAMALIKGAVHSCWNGFQDSAHTKLAFAEELYMGLSGNEIRSKQLEGTDGMESSVMPLQGSSMHSLGDEHCQSFGTCDASGHAMVNTEIFKAFETAKEYIEKSQCGSLEDMLDYVLPRKLYVPMIQATWHYAAILHGSNFNSMAQKRATSSGYTLSRSILPEMSIVNSTNAALIELAFPSITAAKHNVDTEITFRAMAQGIHDLAVDCEQIGEYRNARFGPVCLSELQLVSSMEHLGGSLVSHSAKSKKLARDVKTMRVSLNHGNIPEAARIYELGIVIPDSTENYPTLQTLSTDETSNMLGEPVFMKFLDTFGTKTGIGMAASRNYADKVIQQMFKSRDSAVLTSEASIILNMWMYIIHRLHNVLHACTETDGQNTDSDDNPADVLLDAIDLWFGGAVVGNSKRTGESMHFVSETNARHFETIGKSDAGTSKELLAHVGEAWLVLDSMANCTSSSYARVLELHDAVQKITSDMTVPIVRGLIHSLRVGNSHAVQLYSHAFVPLIRTCGDDTFSQLKELLLGGNYEVSDLGKIFAMIQSSLPCLGLACKQIGAHLLVGPVGTDRLHCHNADPLVSLAGYRPISNVQTISHLDLDAAELDTMLEMKAYRAASEIYDVGHHGPLLSSLENGKVDGASRSLHHLTANTNGLRIVPHFVQYDEYFKAQDPMRQMIRSALDATAPWKNSERREIITRSLQVYTVFFDALRNLYQSVERCEGNGVSYDSMVAWDHAAAILIGHLEGPEQGGSKSDGHMWYTLVQDLCEDFGTCGQVANKSNAQLNGKLIKLLEMGRNIAKARNCEGLQRATEQVSSTLMVPMIQGMLRSTVAVSLASSTPTSSSSHVKNIPVEIEMIRAHIFSRMMVPIIHSIAPSTAQTIDRMLNIDAASDDETDGAVTSTTGRQLFFMLAETYEPLGIKCAWIGKLGDLDACQAPASTVLPPQAGRPMKPSMTGHQKFGMLMAKSGMWIIVAMSSIMILCCAAIVWYRRRWRTSTMVSDGLTRKKGTKGTRLSQGMGIDHKISQSHGRKGKLMPFLRTKSRSSESVRLMSEIDYGSSSTRPSLEYLRRQLREGTDPEMENLAPGGDSII